MRWCMSVMIAASYSLVDLRSEFCKGYCVKDGYTSGFYDPKHKGKCMCIQEKEFSEDQTIIVLPKLPVSSED